jgi:arabinogalactan endo-1,4-beta-galactosidase
MPFFLICLYYLSCSTDNTNEEIPDESKLDYGGDFSIIKKMEDYGAVYKVNGVTKEGLKIFLSRTVTSGPDFAFFIRPIMLGRFATI